MNAAKNLFILVVGVALGIGLFTASKFIDRSGKIVAPLTNSGGEVTIVKEKSDVVDVVKKVGPSVVSIAIKRQGRTPFDSSPFQDFNQNPVQPGPSESGIGTGFIVGSNGVILTNRHVVETAGQYVVITNDNKKYDVTKVTLDPSNDIAILKVDATGLQAITLGDSEKLDVGQTVIAMGNALGEFKNTVTVGVVSGLDRDIEASDQLGRNTERLGSLIQTDAAINPGNSGGPLLNIAGQVIGINTAVASGVAQNIGFAIPINSIKPVIDEFLASGKISRPYLGVEYRMITKRLALINEIPEGAYIFTAVTGGPAAQAGIRAEDIITEINGTKLTETNPLSDVVRGLKIGQQVELKYFRDNQTQTARVTIGEAGE